MKNKRFQKVLCFILSVTMLLSMFGITVFASESDPSKLDGSGEYPYNPSTFEDMEALIGTLSYADYLSSYKKQRDEYKAYLDSLDSETRANYQETHKVEYDIFADLIEQGSNAERVSESQDCTGSKESTDLELSGSWSNFGDWDTVAPDSIYLPASGQASWEVKLGDDPSEHKGLPGWYYIKIEYYSVKTEESSIAAIERNLKINGEIVFDEASSLTFDKNWVYQYCSVSDPVHVPGVADSYDVKYEIRGEGDDKGYYKVVTEVKNEYKTVTTYKIMQDINGNSMAPQAVSVAGWNTYYVKDASGYYDGAFEFYFDGSVRITLEAEREPMIIRSIELVPVVNPITLSPDGKSILGQNDLVPYTQYLANLQSANKYHVPNDGKIIELQAEFPDLISDSSVAATNDNTSARNYPISHNSQLYNVIGENSYRTVGQWAAYKFKVTKTGLYNLGMRFKQDALQGMYICRTIKLHGGHNEEWATVKYGQADGTPEVPFAEAYQAEFNYSKKWQSEFVSKDDTDFLFYFEEGVEYTVYFECSLGTLKEYIQRVEVSLNKINSCYLRILQLIGTEPDEYLDYNYIAVMPDVLITLLEEAKELMAVKGGLEELCGTNGSHIATLETIAILLDTMGKDDGRDIAANMATLKSYLGTLGTWINNSKSSAMVVDSIWVVPACEKDGQIVANSKALPKAKAGFFRSIWFEIQSFISSFFVNYDQMGLTTIPDENALSIDVWLATGRDQSQIWRTMIDAYDEDEGFTYNTGTAVNLKLVTGGTLLPSILSRKGPDVYIGLGAADVINYAIRDAVLPIGGEKGKLHLDGNKNPIFDTTYYSYRDGNNIVTTTQKREGVEAAFTTKPFSEITGPEYFAPAAMDTVTLLGSSYAVPQTMSFAMMFYRMDVFANLQITKIPETWDDLLTILPVLQSNNMSIGVSYIDALDFMIYQSGNSMWKYTDESRYDSKYAGARVDLDNPEVLETFDFTCRLYTDFSFPVSYDASNRFRTGEMPIIIGGYSGIYNTLTVYATEIEGLWEFCSLPGMERKDENGNKYINYDSLANISASVILHGCQGAELFASWQFLQWQTRDDIQANYGNRMVALIGPSAKYESANLKAIKNLSWTAKEWAAIMNQMEHLSSIVNYPGSYIITRYTQFAFLDAVNESADPIDALSSYIEAINSEITRKRKEFGLEHFEHAEQVPPELTPPHPAN